MVNPYKPISDIPISGDLTGKQIQASSESLDSDDDLGYIIRVVRFLFVGGFLLCSVMIAAVVAAAGFFGR